MAKLDKKVETTRFKGSRSRDANELPVFTQPRTHPQLHALQGLQLQPEQLLSIYGVMFFFFWILGLKVKGYGFEVWDLGV